jgi:outer membrane protein OmpU
LRRYLLDRLHRGGKKSETIAIPKADSLFWEIFEKTEGNEMKNLLIATTALVATAGVAVADVKVSGYARFGAVYNDSAAAGTDSTNTASRLRLQFSASTETDGGLTLGMSQRFQAEENKANAGGNGVRFTATTGGLTIAVGNIGGAVEFAPGLYMSTKSAGVGLEGNAWGNLATNTASNGGAFGWTAYNSGGAGAQDGVEVLYSMNGMGLHVHSTDTSYGIGANYKFGDITAAVAYEEFDNGNTYTFASVGGKVGAGNVVLSGAETEIGGVSAQKIVLQGGYNMNDAAYVYGFVATEDNVDEAFGAGVSYALGGGASVEAGWEHTVAGANLVSAGIFFSF